MDNDISVLFTNHFCYVQDLSMKRLMPLCKLQNRLYYTLDKNLLLIHDEEATPNKASIVIIASKDSPEHAIHGYIWWSPNLKVLSCYSNLFFILTELGMTDLQPVTLFCDNQFAIIHLAHNPIQHERTKHISIDCHFTRERCLKVSFNLIMFPRINNWLIFLPSLSLLLNCFLSCPNLVFIPP